MSKVTALIPAAGMGRRMGRAVAKQFLPLGDKPMLAHTLLVFQRASEIDEIIPILSKEDMESCLRDLSSNTTLRRSRPLLSAAKSGRTRS